MRLHFLNQLRSAHKRLAFALFSSLSFCHSDIPFIHPTLFSLCAPIPVLSHCAYSIQDVVVLSAVKPFQLLHKFVVPLSQERAAFDSQPFVEKADEN